MTHRLVQKIAYGLAAISSTPLQYFYKTRVLLPWHIQTTGSQIKAVMSLNEHFVKIFILWVCVCTGTF